MHISDELRSIDCMSLKTGTTGRSKAAIHTHETVLALIMGTEFFPWTVDKPNLILSKATHITGNKAVKMRINKHFRNWEQKSNQNVWISGYMN
jgi:hypothetical protein